MARKSNKTSHVLNLLAGEEAAPEAPEKKEKEEKEKTAKKKPEEDESSEKTSDSGKAASQAETPSESLDISIMTTRDSQGDPLAELIRGQLEENFSEETQESTNPENGAKASALDPAEDAPPIDIPTDSLPGASEDSGPEADEAPVSGEPVQDGGGLTQAEAEPANEEKAGSRPPAEQTPQPAEPSVQASDASTSPIGLPAGKDSQENNGNNAQKHYQFVNVMEYVVKDLILEFMEKFNMCTCERCQVDTMALALTFCPAKYIVVDSQAVSPLLNFYSSKYVSEVSVELTKACIIVKDHPRHEGA